MSSTSDLISTDIEKYLRQHEAKSLLRFITCGSVDDGKSTLIGRLLYESKTLFEDQLATLTLDSKKWGTQGGAIDFALLVDGLAAEREQGITIDVAYRYFATEWRKFIVADTPGHEQYTRNMVTGASTADLAVILVDARKGLLVQTRRHSCLVSLIGIRKIVLAINKMDLVEYSKETFHTIESEYREFAAQLDFEEIVALPISALRGDNIVERSVVTPWYSGSTLLAHLESVVIDEQQRQRGSFRMPVQWINRPNQDFRGFSGLVASGTVKPGDRIRVQPSGWETSVARIVTATGDLPQAVAGQSITLTLTEDLDISRGDLISQADAPAEVADQFEASVVWMDKEPMLPGRTYLLKMGTQSLNVTLSEPKYRLNVNTLEHLAAKRLELNEIGVCNLMMDRAVPFDPYTVNRDTGGFIVIDRLTNQTLAAGTLHFALRRSHNIHLQPVDVAKASRAERKGQRPVVLWFTGISGAGKSTIANLVEKQLHAMGMHTYLLDGDNVRHGLCSDLGFKDADRVENIRRVAEVAKLMVDAGLVVLTAFISPFRSERAKARALLEDGEFIEIHVDAPIEVAEGRDVKGLYRKARSGKLPNFTGVDSPYEAPQQPEIHIDTSVCSGEEAAAKVLDRLRERGVMTCAPSHRLGND